MDAGTGVWQGEEVGTRTPPPRHLFMEIDDLTAVWKRWLNLSNTGKMRWHSPSTCRHTAETPDYTFSRFIFTTVTY